MSDLPPPTGYPNPYPFKRGTGYMIIRGPNLAGPGSRGGYGRRFECWKIGRHDWCQEIGGWYE